MKFYKTRSFWEGIAVTVIGGLILGWIFYLIQEYYPPLATQVVLTWHEIKIYLDETTEISNSIIFNILIFVFLTISVLIYYFYRYILKLRQANSELKNLQQKAYIQAYTQAVNTIKNATPQDLAGLDEKIKISASPRFFSKSNYTRQQHFSIELSWREVFARLAPSLIGHPNDSLVKNTIISKAIFYDVNEDIQINEQDYETIKIHLIALRLVSLDYTPTTTGGMALFWSLTDKGHALMMELRTIKTTQTN